MTPITPRNPIHDPAVDPSKAVDLENPILKGLEEVKQRAIKDGATGFVTVLSFPKTENIAISGLAPEGVSQMISMLFRGAVTMASGGNRATAPSNPNAEVPKEVPTDSPDEGS